MKDTATSRFDELRMAECLIGEARLCEHIAAACADETSAAKFMRMARECKEAAIKNGKFQRRVIATEHPTLIA